MIFDHNAKEFQDIWNLQTSKRKDNRYNGGYYYSREIVKNIIPNVKTNRNWSTVVVKGIGFDHSIVFVHDNKDTKRYEFLKEYKDVVLVCGIPETCIKVQDYGTPIYLPLSIDTEYVSRFKTVQTKDIAFVGRKRKLKGISLPKGIDYICNMPRDELLAEMAKYRKVFAIGRTAIEAKLLLGEDSVLAYDKRFPDPAFWRVLDNKAAARILQSELNVIDG